MLVQPSPDALCSIAHWSTQSLRISRLLFPDPEPSHATKPCTASANHTLMTWFAAPWPVVRPELGVSMLQEPASEISHAFLCDSKRQCMLL